MIPLTTNRFVTKVLQALCCASALAACSAWATVVTWQLNPGASGKVGATSQSGYAITPWRVYTGNDTSRAFSFKTASESGAASETNAAVVGNVSHKPRASETSAEVAGTLTNKPQASDTIAAITGILNHKPQTNGTSPAVVATSDNKPQARETSTVLAGSLNNKLQAGDSDIQLESQSLLPGGDGQMSTRSAQREESSLFAASNSPARPATELDDAMARSFDEEFGSGPTIQFASMVTGSRDVSVTSAAGAIVPLPEMSALFPIVGLIAAISCTQILRRRRAAQQSASRSVV
jgi:hypothetical protein